MRYLHLFMNLTRRSRNYPSEAKREKFSPIVRRRKGYLSVIRMSDKLFNVNIDILKSKYDVGEDIYFDKAPLPNIYYTNEICLMPKNKDTIFAYWEIRDDTYDYFKENNNVKENPVIVLLSKGKFFRKITGIPRFGSMYINNINSDEEYEALIGFEDEKGNFFQVAKSFKVISPSGKISNNLAYYWGISKLVDSKVIMAKYTKDYLPIDKYLAQELIDSENIVQYESEEILKYLGSSEKNIGSSK